MNWEQAKDQIAIQDGFRSYKDMARTRIITEKRKTFYYRASELYAKSKHDEACEAQKTKCVDFIDYNNPMTVKEMILMAPKPEFKP